MNAVLQSLKTGKPILFSGPMVRALLAGTKTQTRRALTGGALAARESQWKASKVNGVWWLLADGQEVQGSIQPSLRYRVGDRLYVREAWRCNGWATDVATIMYRASEGDGYHAMTEQFPVEGKKYQRVTPGQWRPGIHMPRWASRITLIVTDVRVERLQDISEADALAEGIVPVEHRPGGTVRYSGVGAKFGLSQHSAKMAYAHLWDSINGEGSWEANPWVAAYTFTVAMGNIDALSSENSK